ncbi:MAG: hypothetical protein K0Q59_5835 [Paenibacillus sp.]|nr:hypothetical protein [Paenibacillus sp.]
MDHQDEGGIPDQQAERSDSSKPSSSELVVAETAVAAALPVKKPGLSKQSVIIGSALIVAIAGLLATLFLVQQHKERLRYLSLVEEYNTEYQLIFSAAESFKGQIAAGPVENKNLKATISFYRNLNEQILFESKINALNQNPKYAELQPEHKKSLQSLGVEPELAQLKAISTDLDKIQGILQKSENIDNEIKVLLTSRMTYKDIGTKTDDLVKKSAQLQDELIGTVAHVKLKQAQDLFSESLTYRGTFISEYKTAVQADLDAQVAQSLYEKYDKSYREYDAKARAATSLSTYKLYIGWAAEDAKEALAQILAADEKEKQAATHKKQAMDALGKYVELVQTDIIDMNLFKQPGSSEPKLPDGGKEVTT